MSLDVSNLAPEENMMAYIDMNYEDGQKVVMYQNGSGKKSPSSAPVNTGNGKSGVISNNESHFVHSMDNLVSTSGVAKPQVGNVTIGPFQFNICSYKQDGRKFRMVIYIYSPDTTNLLSVNPNNGPHLCCCLISPSFTIRAKKPIVKPGIKGKKNDEVEDKKEKKKRGKKGSKRKADDMSDDDSDHDESSNEGAPNLPQMNMQYGVQMHQPQQLQQFPQLHQQLQQPSHQQPLHQQQQQHQPHHHHDQHPTEEVIEIKEEPPLKRMRTEQDEDQQNQHSFQAPLKKRSMSTGKSPMRSLNENSNGEFSLSFLNQMNDEQQTPQFIDKDELSNTINSLPSQPEQSSHERQRGSNVGSSGSINAGMEKVYAIVQTFQQMTDNDRKQLLCRLIELSMPHEKEFVYRKYFNSDTSSFDGPSQQQQQQPSVGAPSAGMPFMNNYMSAYQYQMIRQQQQELLDYFTSMQQQEDFAQQHMMQNHMFQHMMQNEQQAQAGPSQQLPQLPVPRQNNDAPPQPPVYIPQGVMTGQTSDVDQFFVELFD
jgi:hypothetical protein